MENDTTGQMNDFFHNLDASCSLLIAGAYLLGSIPFGLLIGKAHGVDIREQLLEFHSKYYSANLMRLVVSVVCVQCLGMLPSRRVPRRGGRSL